MKKEFLFLTLLFCGLTYKHFILVIRSLTYQFAGYYVGVYIEIILSSSTHRELKTFILSYQFCKDKRLCPFFLILTRLLLPFLRYHIFCHILSLPRKSLLNVKQILCLLLLVWTFIVTFLLMLFYRRKQQGILHLDINLHDSIYIIILVMQLYVFNVQYFFVNIFYFLG